MGDGVVQLITGKLLGLAKGATGALYATVREIDADHNALDVSVNGSPTVTQGTAAAANAPWYVRLSDGAAAVGVALDATLTGGTQIAIAKGAAATGAAVSGNPVYVAGIDGSGNARPPLMSAAGNAQTSAAKGTSYSSAAAESSAVVSASACSPSMVNVRNTTGTTRYVQFFNAGAVPANGTVPKFMFMLTANSDQQKTFPVPTDRFSSGMTIASSSTAATLTISAGTDLLIQVDLYPSST